MKKTFIVILTILLIFLLVACRNRDNDEPQERPTIEFDIDDTLNGKGRADIIWGEQDEATQQSFIDSVKEDGYEVSFNSDGSMTMTNPGSGETFVQSTDGTWIINGEEARFGGNWPANEFTRLVPKPDISVYEASADASGFSADFSVATIEQIKAYAEKVKKRGFTLGAEEIDQSIGGCIFYSFSASNANGYSVEIFFSNSASSLMIRK